jgi:splicing factor 3B subunit 3
MHLYHLTLKKSNGCFQSVVGNFCGQKTQELLVSNGNSIDLYSVNDGKLVLIVSTNTYATVRSITPFRLTGASKDFVVVGSDSGRISVLEFNPEKSIFEKVHQETFGKTGCRRVFPGQFVAADPKGRAVMLAAMEKQKLVYILNRDPDAKPTIHSLLHSLLSTLASIIPSLLPSKLIQAILWTSQTLKMKFLKNKSLITN